MPTPTAGDAAAAAQARANKFPEKKGGPTPRRRDQVAARRQPLVQADRKAARKAQRQALADERAKTRRAMETGDERHMPVRDRGPQKRFVREFIDARYGIGEWLLILMVVFLFVSLLLGDQVMASLGLALYGLILAVIVESFWVARRAKRLAAAKFGPENVEKGLGFYAAMRSMQLRRLRLPKPMNGRGEYPA
ncbi:DUF3043 domain-containing protein [Nesterenkonia pannonica]|uniref:DUF3043 domain-containing protein n=1 Tax=Nesterenkonia pannonica TaxID=1548602 RepID=UPI002164981F|nr:DUF3043 domain-containing protein [Nesterenkonia pannonica]